MGKLAFVFPGQGAQQPGMGEGLYRASPTARRMMDQAETMMPGLLEVCFRGPMETLTRTDWAQPALYMLETALAQSAFEMGLAPEALAGFSLGEWSACQAGGMVGFEQGFALVKQRGSLMQALAENSPGSMAAVLRLDDAEVRRLAESQPDVWAVNFNAPGQTVVAGSLPGLALFEAHVREMGGRMMRLQVAGAFHSPLMAPASDRMAALLEEEDIRNPSVPVISNLTARPYQAGSARDWLARQLSSPVQWVDSVRHLAQQGFDTFLELGPGKVLSGLIKKILPEATTLQAEDLEGLENAARQLKETA